MYMKTANRIVVFLSIILLVVFLPVLFCVVLIGNHMDYTESMKIITRLPNQVLFLIALIGLFLCMYLFWKFKNIKLSPRVNWIANAVLFFLFAALYFVNIRIAKEIAYYLPWDILVVREVANTIANEQNVGYLYYFSMYSNNIPITYILGRLLRKAMHMQNYPYNADFIWIQVNCALISIAGYFNCLTVKKLTKKIMPVVAVFFLYLVLVWLSPWKIAPYTDTYGLIFPIICIYFYISYRNAEHVWSKYLCIILSIAAGMLGGFVKPNIYIVIIAILGTELICCLKDFKKRWGFILTEIALVIVLAIGTRAYIRHIIDEIGFDFNPQIEASWQHYFLMGLNEYSTGGYNMDDVGIFGQYEKSKSDRIHAEMKMAAERMKERGFFGSIYFYLRKMVMTFNDGVFGWRTEAWIQEYYPYSIASNTALTQWLRYIFWGSGNEMGIDIKGYNTLCQLVWIFSILGIPGICLCRGEKRQEYGIFIICFLGIFFYQMLFEARARYLFVFLPILLSMSVCGINQYTYCLRALWEKRKTTGIKDGDNTEAAQNGNMVL